MGARVGDRYETLILRWSQRAKIEEGKKQQQQQCGRFPAGWNRAVDVSDHAGEGDSGCTANERGSHKDHLPSVLVTKTVTLSPSRTPRFWPSTHIFIWESLRLDRTPPRIRRRNSFRRSSTMPVFLEQPVEPVVLVRDLADDENYVIAAFENHASHCSKCADPVKVHREDRSLCKRGHQYARDVAEYLCSKNGKIYSVVDLERNQPTLVKVPLRCDAVRQLLEAIEEGLRVNRKDETTAKLPRQRPVISYDQTYPAPPRRTEPVACDTIIEREPRALQRRRVIVHNSPKSSPSRGSLYEADAADRITRVNRSSRIYRPSEYYR
ncbi:hypothetical protein BO70DRAFT_397878 [Aspergillus heteromorphus CBS 117.55]|uniref:Uncharacterized protein n=1 Tax=Aspergillus heteromorphus CBS 117.55 TaxID=1448321 RepID=A0A317VTT8_9EURO|nr:uncharacterized protein BO70DRAFT_397878 [Aspergillus heteromorphus CBS 117.55]PWY76989.1 hypothetical protein BO70DRAFT_397878 [Aspergillus heteromorphus CBS 117.55]